MRTKITWNTENVPLPAIDCDRVGEWLVRVAAAHGFSIGKINYVFTDDPSMLDLNIRALGHDYFTDIITFDYTSGAMAGGDIYISLDTVASNADGMGAPYMTELHRVIAHGLLHLCGVNDKGPGEREIMERCEDEALRLIDPGLLS